MNNVIWHNGFFVPDGPVFCADDRIRLGDGVFDTMLAVDGSPVFARDHFDRLHRHADVMGIVCPYAPDELIAVSADILKKNNILQGRAVIHTVLTRGAGAPGIMIPENAAPSCVMRASALMNSPPRRRAAVIARTVRRNVDSPLSRIKSLNYGDQIMALREVRQRDADEAIMLNGAGNLTCASAGNVFAVVDGTIYTPPLSDGVMDGIIRGRILSMDLAQERSINEADMVRAESIFITSSISGILPLDSLDGRLLSLPPLTTAQIF